ncbi:hypothetical protein GBAR_LOCUS184, partial [Geodia barretti]
MTLQEIDSVPVTAVDSQLPMYTCGRQHKVLLHGNVIFRGFMVQPRLSTDVFDPNAPFVGAFVTT